MTIATILSWLANSWLGRLVAKYVIDRLTAMYTSYVEQKKAKAATIDQAKKDSESIKKAETPNEIDKAADDVLNHF